MAFRSSSFRLVRPAGAVLAGGSSKRMGQDKALLRFGPQTLLEWAVERLRPLADPLYISGQGYAHPQAQCVEDRNPGCGPLGGLEALLSTGVGEGLLVLAVDLPLVRTATLEALFENSQTCDVVIPRSGDGRLQPLCGFYRSSCLDVVRALLHSGRRRAQEICSAPGLRIAVIDAALLGCGPREFMNVNTPTELAEALQLVSNSPKI